MEPDNLGANLVAAFYADPGDLGALMALVDYLQEGHGTEEDSLFWYWVWQHDHRPRRSKTGKTWAWHCRYLNYAYDPRQDIIHGPMPGCFLTCEVFARLTNSAQTMAWEWATIGHRYRLYCSARNAYADLRRAWKLSQCDGCRVTFPTAWTVTYNGLRLGDGEKIEESGGTSSNFGWFV